MTPPAAASAPEFSRLLPLERLDREGTVEIEIVAEASECAGLATRFGLAGLEALSARLKARRNPVGEVVVTGTLSARPVYTCVVSLEPFVGSVDERVALRFAPADEDEPVERNAGPDDDDPPEPLPDDALDLGEIVAEQLALGLDPHPRAPGASLDDEAATAVGRDGGDARPVSPFAALERLRRDR
ncbi:MAG: DUF177 domain-containing protein [Alphaproteobacteria bacterium]